MRKEPVRKKLFSLTSALLLCAVLSGCQYSNVEEYLELLGMKDPAYYSDEIISGSSETYIVSEDSTVSYADQKPSFLDETEDSDTHFEQQKESLDEPSSEGSSEEIIFFSEDDEKRDAGDEKFTSSYKQLTEAELNEEMKAARIAAGLTDDNIARIKEQQKGLYAYERLTSSGKTLYAEILSILQNMSENVPVSTTSDEAIGLVFDYCMADHPEIFYVDGYKYTNYTVDNVITKIAFSGNYTCTPEEVATKQAQINQAVSECLAGAPATTDDYYVIKYIYEYLITHTDYDVGAPDNQNISSVFINHRSVCNGYAKATQYLLNKLDIKCTLVTGTVDTKSARNVRHAWNLVLCNDAYYHLDTTWGDSSYQTGNGENADATRLPQVNYDYLNVTTDEINRNHTISDDIYIPVCSSMKDNYYVREDEYFTSAELVLVKELFDRRYSDGSDSVVIKCADKQIYDSFFDSLISQRQVFDYLQGDTSTVSYTTFADTNTIIFWLY